MGQPALLFVWKKSCRLRRRKGEEEMAEKKASTADKVWALAAPLAEALGLAVWDVRFVKEGADWFLRVFIDKAGGVTLDDCEALSRALDAPLDQADPIPQSYCLEVCSPGLERELTRPLHFEQMLGRPVVVVLIRPQNGKKELSGVLAGYENGVILLRESGGGTVEINKKETARVYLDDFDAGGGIEA